MYTTTYILKPLPRSASWVSEVYRSLDELQTEELLILEKKDFAYLFAVNVSPEPIAGTLQKFLESRHTKDSFTINLLKDQTESFKFFLELLIGKDDGANDIREILTWAKEHFNQAMLLNSTGPIIGQIYRQALNFAQSLLERPDFRGFSITPAEAIIDISRKIAENIENFQVLLCGRNKNELAALNQIMKRTVGRHVYLYSENFQVSHELSLDLGVIPIDANQFAHLLKKDTLIVNVDLEIATIWNLILPYVTENRDILYIYFQFSKINVPRSVRKLANVFFQNIEHIQAIIELYRQKRKAFLHSLEDEIAYEMDRFNAWVHSDERYRYTDIISHNREMQKIFELIRRIAPVNISVLIIGDTGTGKELVARAIHLNSRRSDKKFIAVNCSAIPETLLEAELFGYEKGAFTGALNMKKGLVEMASGGTLFLDEIGDIPPLIQVKLLRVLQEREIMRLGNPEPIKVDVRLVAATNQNLEELIEQNKFRTDLYFRVNTVKIRLPNLVERHEDILLLTRYFIEKFNQVHNKIIHAISDDVKDRLQKYHWPGNIRELENVIERAVAVSVGAKITLTDLPEGLQNLKPSIPQPHSPVTSLKDLEAAHIKQLLIQEKQNYGKVAELLGISRTTLWRKLKEYNIAK